MKSDMCLPRRTRNDRIDILFRCGMRIGVWRGNGKIPRHRIACLADFLGRFVIDIGFMRGIRAKGRRCKTGNFSIARRVAGRQHRREVAAEHGYSAAPIVQAGSRSWSGFRPAEIDRIRPADTGDER